MLTIGELARATGVAASALRYWEQLGVIPAPERVSGKRRYPPSTVDLVGEVLLLRDTGYTLREVEQVMARRGAWRELAERKLAELDERIAKAQAARTAIAHGLACEHPDVRECPTFIRGRARRLAGASLAEAHGH